jgi:hypothetical protein
MTPATDTLRIRADQHVDDVFCSKLLACPRNARQDFLRGDRGVLKSFDFIQANVACVARPIRKQLTEIL